MLTDTRDPVALAFQADKHFMARSANGGDSEDGLDVEAASPFTTILKKITPANPPPVSNQPAVSVTVSLHEVASPVRSPPLPTPLILA